MATFALAAGGDEAALLASIDSSVTLEQHLDSQCEKLVAELDAHIEALVAKLRTELEAGKGQVRASLQAPPLKGGSAGAQAGIFNAVKLVATAGPYEGQTWVLRPTSPPSKGACMLGRSTGKRFKESGISMSKDSSVSTTHAKITVSGGRLYFADAGSTNGSTVNGINVGKEGAPVELSTGMVLGVGETLLTVTLVSV